MNFFQKHHRFLFYGAWLILALAQSASTELIADEAYYWVYSKFPAWGYFDHPPMVAVLIKAGYGIFHNELGVRLMFALLNTLAIVITESLIERKNPISFYTIVLSLGILQVAGFFAVPDTPLLFFTALFFYTYRSFIQNASWKNTLLLAITIALLFYTKYHGLLIVFFTVLSNLKLFLRWQLWFVALLVLIFYSPHLYWQWQHDWISFRYHLFESNVNAYKFSYTTDYLLGQLLLAGPLAGFLLLPAACDMAKKVTDALTGAGIWGVELFLTHNGVYFSELSPRPHDTGMVTLAGTQNFSEFELHARGILGLPIPHIYLERAGASAAILANKTAEHFKITGLEKALEEHNTDIRIFGKPTTRPYRRMGVALAHDDLNADMLALRMKAKETADKISIH